MTYIIMALRNLSRQKRRSILLGGAIAFSLFFITMINSFTGSFVYNVSENFSQMMAGHIFIQGYEKTEANKTISIIRDDAALIEAIEAADLPVVHLTRVSEFNGTLIFGGKSMMQSVISTNWQDAAFLQSRISLKEGSFENMVNNPKGIIISHKIAKRLKIELNDTVLFRLRTVIGQQNVGDFEVAGINYDSGLISGMSAYANLAYVNELLDIAPGEYQSLGLFLENIDQIEDTATRYFTALKPRVNLFSRTVAEDDDRSAIRAMMDEAEEEEWEGVRFRLFTLNDMLDWLEQMVDTINTAGLIILMVLFLIVIVGITNTFRMIMIERIKEIGTMRALGIQRDGISRLFLLEAFFLALAGSASGLLVAGGVMFILSLINWGVDNAFFIFLNNGHMSFQLVPWQVALNVGIVTGLTIIAALIPALKAALLQPTDALRGEIPSWTEIRERLMKHKQTIASRTGTMEEV